MTDVRARRLRARIAVLAVGSAILALLLYGNIRILAARLDYENRAKEALGNRPLQALYEERRSGDVVTLDGFLEYTVESVGSEKLVRIALAGTGRSINLAGADVTLCPSDRIAASGVYTYDVDGGVVTIWDPRNVAVSVGGILHRRDLRGLRWFFPSWCWLT
jgi:hypothetical protein